MFILLQVSSNFSRIICITRWQSVEDTVVDVD